MASRIETPPRNHTAALVAWAWLAFPPAAFAAHPLITEDSGVQGSGNWQLELNTDRAVERGSDLASHAVNAGLTYGASDDLDLALNLSWQRNEVSDDPLRVERGIGDAEAFAKWRFYQQDGLSLALKPILSMPTGDEKKELGSGRAGAAVVGIATWEAGGLSLSGNLGYAWNNVEDERKDIWSASAALLFGITEELSAAFEMGAYTNSDPACDKHPSFANVGLIYSPTDSLDLDIGYLRGLNDAEVRHSMGAGVTLRW